jgi:hypothetical protein
LGFSWAKRTKLGSLYCEHLRKWSQQSDLIGRKSLNRKKRPIVIGPESPLTENYLKDHFTGRSFDCKFFSTRYHLTKSTCDKNCHLTDKKSGPLDWKLFWLKGISDMVCNPDQISGTVIFDMMKTLNPETN